MTPRQKADEEAHKIYQNGYYSVPKLQSDIADTLEPLYKRIDVLEAMERQVMDLSHPNFKELQKRIEELENHDCKLCHPEEHEQKIKELEAKNLELTKALDNAHKLFGSESDKLGNRILELEDKLEKAKEIIRREVLRGTTNGWRDRLEKVLKEIEEGK